MPTYRVITLGCKVNHYESLQAEELLQANGYTPADDENVDLVIVNTCSVTASAAAKSRNVLRRSVRQGIKTIAMGCWTTSNPRQARELLGEGCALSHRDDLAAAIVEQIRNSKFEIRNSRFEISDSKYSKSQIPGPQFAISNLQFQVANHPSPSPAIDLGVTQGDCVCVKVSESDAGALTGMYGSAEDCRLHPIDFAHAQFRISNSEFRISNPGSLSLPQLSHRQPLNQRAILKIQDGCDAHCTYCIIPKLRPLLWSRPADQVILEARRLIAASHHEIILTGIFLGAYGQTTALHRRQTHTDTDLAYLIHRLCDEVPGMRRLRLSSLEPGDVTPRLIAALKAHPQVMPHFHLPFQSGSDAILRKMNRQYTLADYLTMVEQLQQAFDRPAITTDIIVGFPGESADDFLKTSDAARAVGFLHIHAFPFSPREGTAAARWSKQMVPQRLITERMRELEILSAQLSQSYRQQFLHQEVELLVEHPSADEIGAATSPTLRHGRCERYFAVHFESPHDLTGQLIRVRINQVTADRTLGTLVQMR